METKKLISVGDLCKKSFAFYKQRLNLILSLALVVFASYLIFSLLLELVGRGPNNAVFTFGIGLLTLVFGLFYLVLVFWVSLSLMYAIKEEHVTKDVKSLMVFSWGKTAPYSWVAFLSAIITLAGSILFIIPGIIFYIWYSLALYVFVFEDVKGFKALQKSRELVKGYWWPVLGRLLLFWLVAVIINTIPVIGDVMNIFLIVPMGIIYMYFMYEDLKTIKSS